MQNKVASKNMNPGSKYALPLGSIVTKYRDASVQLQTPNKDRGVFLIEDITK
jgi:hypothetical protein